VLAAIASCMPLFRARTRSHTHAHSRTNTHATHTPAQADTLLGLMEAQHGGGGVSEEIFVRTCAADAGLLRIFPPTAGGLLVNFSAHTHSFSRSLSLSLSLSLSGAGQGCLPRTSAAWAST
jgi:hypothetical protein